MASIGCAAGYSRPDYGLGLVATGTNDLTLQVPCVAGQICPPPFTATVSLPSMYDPDVAWPLLHASHGWGGNSHSMMRYHYHGQKAGYIVVTPGGYDEGTNSGSFNGAGTTQSPSWLGPTCYDPTGQGGFCSMYDGSCSCASQPDNCVWTTCYDSVDQANYVLDLVQEHLCVNTSLVFSTGYSNGGIFQFELATNPKSRWRFNNFMVTAGAPHAGYNYPPLVGTSLLLIAGTRDHTIPSLPNFGTTGHTGNPTSTLDTTFTVGAHPVGWYYNTARNVSLLWASTNQCDREPISYILDREYFADAVEDENKKVSTVSSLNCTEWLNCANESRVIECLHGLGHIVPTWAPELYWHLYIGRHVALRLPPPPPAPPLPRIPPHAHDCQDAAHYSDWVPPHFDQLRLTRSRTDTCHPLMSMADLLAARKRGVGAYLGCSEWSGCNCTEVSAILWPRETRRDANLPKLQRHCPVACIDIEPSCEPPSPPRPPPSPPGPPPPPDNACDCQSESEGTCMFGMNFDCGCAQWSGPSFVAWCWVRNGGGCHYATASHAFTDHAWRPCVESPDGITGSSRWGYDAYAVQAVGAFDLAPPPAPHRLGLEAKSPMNSSLHMGGPQSAGKGTGNAFGREQIPPAHSGFASFVAGILFTFSAACVLLAARRRWQRRQQREQQREMTEAHDGTVLSGVRGMGRVHFDEQQQMMMVPEHRRVTDLVRASSAPDIAGARENAPFQ